MKLIHVSDIYVNPEAITYVTQMREIWVIHFADGNSCRLETKEAKKLLKGVIKDERDSEVEQGADARRVKKAG